MCDAQVHYFRRGNASGPPLPADVILENARAKKCHLDVQGYELLPMFPPFLDDGIDTLAFRDPSGFADRIFPQAESCLRKHLEASRVLCFDHIVRDGGRKRPETTGKKEDNAVNFLGGPIPQVHNDYR